MVPVSFVSEHIETLEEIDMEYKELAIENGIKFKCIFPCFFKKYEVILTGFRHKTLEESTSIKYGRVLH